MDKVLFICVHNSARSQMAEEFLRKYGADDFEAESAGFKPTGILPEVIEVMKEEGVDLTGKKTKSAFELYKAGNMYNFVITVCDDSVDDMCPIYPGMVYRLSLPFPDPAKVGGNSEEKINKIREIRDDIRKVVLDFIEKVKSADHDSFCRKWDCRLF